MKKTVLVWTALAGLVASAGAWGAMAKSAGKASGIALSDSTGTPSVTDIPGESWPSNYLGIQWWENQYNVIVADFNGDKRSDILLQSKAGG
jgi:hypothetical protein